METVDLNLFGRLGGKKNRKTTRKKKVRKKGGRRKKRSSWQATSLTWFLVGALVLLMGGIGFLKWAKSGTGQAALLVMGSDAAYGEVQLEVESVLSEHLPYFRPGPAFGPTDLDWSAPQWGENATVRCRVVALENSLAYEQLQRTLDLALNTVGAKVLWGQKLYPENKTSRPNDQTDLLRLDLGVNGKPTHTLVLHRGKAPKNLVWGDYSSTTPWADFQAEHEGPVVALVIDDWGNFRNDVTRGLLKLPAPMTMAVLPNLPFSRQYSLEETDLILPQDNARQDIGKTSASSGRKIRLDAGCFVEVSLKSEKKKVLTRRREIILHLPMEPEGYPKKNPGKAPLLVGMDAETIEDLLSDKLRNLPGVTGLNNHMGSAATSDAATMTALMQVLKKRNMFFFDSLTTRNSVAYDVALKSGIPTLRNRIFLDFDSENEKTITANLNALVSAAKRKGFAVGIGHPHPATWSVLAREIPRLKKAGVRFVTVSEMLALKKSASGGK
ncbi:MAG: divergent polysaccharide deacetylase family protein [bacterium]|nr:divergent polysaccharide deacetylase family protein [bacterium]